MNDEKIQLCGVEKMTITIDLPWMDGFSMALFCAVIGATIVGCLWVTAWSDK